MTPLYPTFACSYAISEPMTFTRDLDDVLANDVGPSDVGWSHARKVQLPLS
jgi:hypothetical protein